MELPTLTGAADAPAVFRPAEFTVYRLPAATWTRTRSGARVRCWDVLWRADGARYRRRFTTETGGRRAAAGFADLLRAGWLDPDRWWDAGRRTWVARPAAAGEVTVGAWLLAFWDARVDEWEPATRPRAALALRRAILGFADAIADGQTVAELDDYLGVGERELGPHLAAFCQEHSLRMADIDAGMCQMLVGAHRGPATAPATERRWVSVLRSAFALAVARGILTADPFDTVMLKRRGGQRSSPVAGGVLDADLVPSPAQVWALADAVGARRDTYRVLVLLMGVCGLRLSEARGLRVGDVEVDASGRTWVKVSQTARLVSARWVADGEPADVGPLKGRAPGQFRRVPVPARFAAVLADYVSPDADPAAWLCPSRSGQAINVSSFARHVWAPAVEELFEGTALARLRRHDLRHAACSAWLTAGVPVKVAQTWSGHQSLSVFLNIYQGVLAGQEAAAADGFDTWSADAG